MLKITIPDEQAHDPFGFAARNYATGIMAAAGGFSRAVYCESQLSLREFEGARMRTAQLNGCAICQDFRSERDAKPMYSVNGETPATMVTGNGPAPDEAFFASIADWQTATVFSPRERLAIEFAERFATEPKVLSADADFWVRMHDNFSDGEIVDLAHCTAAWMGLGRVAHVLGFDSVCLFLPAQEAAE